MLYMPNVAYYLNILTVKKVQDFGVENFGGCLKSRREKIYSIVGEEEKLQNCFMHFH